MLLRTMFQTVADPAWQYLSRVGTPYQIEGRWQVAFIAGRPALPAQVEVDTLVSWTEWTGDREAFQAFSGTARYTITFDRPATVADAWALDLGTVCHSASVRLNGQELGVVFARPYRIILPDDLREGQNKLEIDVTNLMANRLADLDRRKIPWQRFLFVNIQYQPFDASEWEPVPSGLLGPVRLMPLSWSDSSLKHLQEVHQCSAPVTSG